MVFVCSFLEQDYAIDIVPQIEERILRNPWWEVNEVAKTHESIGMYKNTRRKQNYTRVME